MKKLILSTMAAAAFSTSAMAEAVAPTLKISGNTIMNIYAVSQKVRNNGKGRGYHFSNDVSDLFFLVGGRTSGGIEYKYKIDLQTYSNAHPVVVQNYIEFNTTLGTIQFGNVVGPEDSMIEDAGSIVGGTGGFDGGYKNVYNFAAFAMRGNDNIGDTGYATKIVYYTPELWNFRFGIAHTPQTSHLGSTKLNNDSIQNNGDVPGVRQFLPPLPSNMDIIGLGAWAFGLSFKKDVGNWGVNLNGAYITDQSYLTTTNNNRAFYGPAIAGDTTQGKSKLKLKNTSAYQLGLVIGYRLVNGHLFQLASGWLDSGKSRKFLQQATITSGGTTLNTGNLHRGDSGKAWNVGGAYTFGAYKIATTYQHIQRKTGAIGRAKTDVWSLTGDMVPVAGLKFFGEVDCVRTKSNAAARTLSQNFINAFDTKVNNGTRATKNNSAAVFTTGAKISF
jgi:Gram-negative porin